MEERKIDRVDEEPQIDLFRLFQEFGRAFCRLFWLPVLLTVLAGALFFLWSWRTYTPMYASEVTFTIQMADDVLMDLGGSASYYDKATAEQLAKTFPHIIQSELLQAKLRERMGTQTLNGNVTASTVANTNLFTLRAVSQDPQTAYDLLTTVMEVYPEVADYVIGSTKMQLLTQPLAAAEPYNPFHPLRTVLKGAALGLAAGMALILAYALTRRSIREPEELRRELNQRCLACIPRVSFKRRSKAENQVVSIQNPRISNGFQESVRSMRVKFLREMEKKPARIVMVTSTLPGEGKTTVAVNLALTLSQNGSSVILVDLDLRKPSVKKALGISAASRGVPELLGEKEADPAACLVKVGEGRLRLLAGDRPAEDVRRQLNSRRLAAVVSALREEADYLILDTPPCGLVADSAALARLTDCAVYVIRSGMAQVSHVLDSLQFLGESGTRLLGCVLNGTQSSRGGYGYDGYYGKYSSYGKKRAENPKEVR